MSVLQPAQETSLIKVLTDFPNYFQNFQNNFQGLLSQSNYVVNKHPELRGEYDKLVNDASISYTKLVNIKNALDSIGHSKNSVIGWVKNVFGMGNLGFLPLIIAGVSAASAYALFSAVGKWFTDTNTFAKKLDFMKTQEAKGTSPQQAASMANQLFGEPQTETLFLGLPIKWLIAGAVLIFVAPPLLNFFSSRRK